MSMTDAEKIQIAADMIHDELMTLGTHISAADSLWLATRLHEIWQERHYGPHADAWRDRAAPSRAI